MMSDTDDWLAINTMRTLAIDAVEAAGSGHPGTPMALAPAAFVLWNRILSFDPKDPQWPNRDRFVLSNGHASMLLWSLLHLTRTQSPVTRPGAESAAAVGLQDIRRFRQWGSRAPGHPEYPAVAGVEATTGPLGQGIATSVGMAIAERWLRDRYSRPDAAVFDYYTYAFCGDGCLMEGVGSEAASLAGHLGLDHLCWVYDNNGITIEGSTRLAFSEDVEARFTSYGWRVVRVRDGNDLALIEQALRSVRSASGRPTLVILDTHIGFGSPHRQDTAAAHGEPLGAAEVRLAKRSYRWPEDAQFLVPEGVTRVFDRGIGERGARLRAAWRDDRERYRLAYPSLSAELDQIALRDLPQDWDRTLPHFAPDPKGVAGRDASGQVLNALEQTIPWLIGGSADLGPSTKTTLRATRSGDFEVDTPLGRNLHFGIREHAMAAAVNGLALSGIRAFGSSFFVFSDYARPAIRMSALMELPSIFIFTHDGLGDGEDGPTHQPIEHLASLRAMPGLTVLRPGDANEVVEAYRYSLGLRDRPVVLVLSRQPLPTLDRTHMAAPSGLASGAYILVEAHRGLPDVILIASGSELCVAVDAHHRLASMGIGARVVSMPSWDLFERQSAAYRNTVLPPSVWARVAIEQASPFGWERYVGALGTVVAMKRFGASAPLKELRKAFGFEVDDVVEVVLQTLTSSAHQAGTPAA